MTHFNAIKDNNKVTSYEGGRVYIKSPIEEWLNFLFSSYLEDRFYEDKDEQMSRFLDLTEDVAEVYGGYEFIAKCALFARNELGMRSVAQLVAAWLNDKQFDGKRKFFATFPHRPDDVAEVFAALEILNQKYSHALNRGFADYLSTLSDYSIGKYKMNSRKWNMHDIINRTHAYSQAINDYQRGQLAPVDTWETAISTASPEKKAAEWKRLVEEGKLGYLALIRNLRNIYANDEINDFWIKRYLVPQLTNIEAIHRSMVFPYQIYAAAKHCKINNLSILHALSAAFKISVTNMPKLDGKNIVILDVSGSMDCRISRDSNITIKEAGAVYAAAMMLANPDTEFIKFGNYALQRKLRMTDNIFLMIDQMVANDDCGYGTIISSAFKLMNKPYDRIFVISDMQVMDKNKSWSWDNPISGSASYDEYCKQYGAAELFSFDLGNYHTQYANPNNPNVHLLTSLSEKTFKMIELLSQGESIVDYINNVYDYR